MGEILPCPFCGHEGKVMIFKGKDGWRDRYTVLCRYDEGGCGAESGMYHSEEEAIAAWNTRSGREVPMVGIRGIRMPESCGDCAYKGARLCYLQIWSASADERAEEVPKEGRPDWCPLVDLSNREEDEA